MSCKPCSPVRNFLRAILHRGLGLQVVGLAAFVALVGGGLVGWAVTDRARSALRDSILSNSLATVDLATAVSASYTDDAEAAARDLASRPSVRAAVRAADFSALSADLERWMAEHPNIAVSITDLDGVTQVSGLSDKSSIGQSRIDQDWFQRTITTGQPFLDAPSVSPVTHKARVPYDVPVRDETGAIRGVLTASIQLDALSNIITSIHVGHNARASLIDLQRGVVLAHVDATRILTPASSKNSAAQRMRAGERGVLEDMASTGEHVLAAFGPVPGVPWGILIQQPSVDAFAPLDDMVHDAMWLVGATVALAVVFGTALALRITWPLQRLRTTAEAMASGDLDRRAELDRRDEAGQLGRAFDRMADRLQASIGRANDGEASIRAVMDSVADAIVTVDAGGTIDSSNLAAQLLFCYSAAELVGQSIGQLLPESVVRGTDGGWFGKIRSGELVPSAGCECEGKRQDGTSVPLEVAISETRLNGRRRLILVARDITERKQAEEALRNQALHDELTGLPNRTLLQDRAAQAMLAARRDSTPLTLLLLDLDRFKEINDTFGHHYGDLLLQQIGPRIRNVLRTSDTVARLGGDEFGILLPGIDTDASAAVAQQLLQSLEAPFELEGQSFEIGASIGVAGYPGHGSDTATLLRRADVAMYVAKRGQTGVVVYTSEQDHYSARRLALGGELRRAIEQNELLLHFQPKLDLSTGTLVGVEALVRWQHSQRGFLPPSEFVPLAEQTGLIYPLTRWVLEAALRQHHAWRATGLDIPVAVNLSRRSLHDPHLSDMVAELLARLGVASAGLELEITEGSLMSDPARAAENLIQLRTLGVRVSVDDFGTGYSSLASLKNLAVDELKIDQSFVQAMATDASSRAIVRAIIDLADNLNLRVVAEGIEDRATWDVLVGLGCGVGQGYFISRPIAADELEAWARNLSPTWLAVIDRSAGVDDALQERIRGQGARLTAEEEFVARKQAEAALRASEERNRVALRAAGMGTWDVDIASDVHTWSPETEALFGLTQGAFAGELANFQGAIHTDDWRAVDAEWHAALSGHRDFSVSYRTVWPDGSTHWIEDNGRAQYAADGTPVRMSGTSKDVTERKVAEEALRASEERFRRQYKGFPLPTYSWLQVGDDFVMQDYNDAAEAIAEGDVREWIGELASERYANEPDVIADLLTCVTEQRTVHRVIRFHYPVSGRERELALSYVFVPPRSVMLHNDDITAHRQAEQQA
jgi:diguanylate cyclase (GGDEF)-like protein/PAS domain S-box-containing protein